MRSFIALGLVGIVGMISLTACNEESFKGRAEKKQPVQVQPPQDCEQAGTCPPQPSCEDTNTCPPPPSCEETNTCPPPPPPPVPQFGLLVNDPACAFCHVKIHGDVASTRDVLPLWENSKLEVSGIWYAAGAFEADTADYFGDPIATPHQPVPAGHPLASKGVAISRFGRNVDVSIAGGVQKNLQKHEKLPRDLDADGKADFPRLDIEAAKGNVGGRLTTPGGEVINKVHNGNLLMVGTEANPIQLDGEILVTGDLVLKGYYKGIGTLYAGGNIYIPADLKAVSSAFPFPKDHVQALTAAKQALKDKKDALALATPHSILIGNIADESPAGTSPYDGNHFAVPADRDFAALGIKDVYAWLPEAQYEQLYDSFSLHCPSGRADRGRSFSLVEAFLFAGNTIGGWANVNSYSINGGVIADHFHIISAAKACPGTTHPVHGQPSNFNYINFDFRMQAGLSILKELAPYFTAE